MPLSEEKLEIINKYYKVVKEGKKSFNYFIKKEYVLEPQAAEDRRMSILDIYNNVKNEFKMKNLGSISLNTMTKYIKESEVTISPPSLEVGTVLKDDKGKFIINPTSTPTFSSIQVDSRLSQFDRTEKDDIVLMSSGLLRKQRNDKGKPRIKKIDGFKQI